MFFYRYYAYSVPQFSASLPHKLQQKYPALLLLPIPVNRYFHKPDSLLLFMQTAVAGLPVYAGA